MLKFRKGALEEIKKQGANVYITEIINGTEIIHVSTQAEPIEQNTDGRLLYTAESGYLTEPIPDELYDWIKKGYIIKE